MEAQVERLELDHAAEDFRRWMTRIVSDDRPFEVEAPLSAYAELSLCRARTYLAGTLRAWGSALDCLVGVAGLPSDLTRAGLHTAVTDLRDQSGANNALVQLQRDHERAELCRFFLSSIAISDVQSSSFALVEVPYRHR